MRNRPYQYPLVRLWGLVAVSMMVAIMARCMADLNATGGGSGTEIGNPTVSGQVVDTSGIGVPNTQIRLYPSDYGPASSFEVRTDTTDMHGNYSFSNVRQRTYNLTMVNLDNRMRTILCGIMVGRDSVSAPTAVIRKPGTIIVAIPDALGEKQGFVFIPGTGISVWRNAATRSVTLDSVPAGMVPPVRFAPADAAAGDIPLATDSIALDPTDTVRTAFLAWKFSKRLSFNTTASGADVAGTVTDFPVLIRLNASNFRFDQANPDGSDIRFAKRDDNILPHAIAAWDAINQRAELWVRLDTIHGNDADQFIIMYWGNPGSRLLTSSTAVFDSSNGFAGVWHLNETAGKAAADASHHGCNGTYRGGLPKSERSPTGIGQRFAGADTDFVDMGNVLNPGRNNISIGLWFKRASPFGVQQTLVGKTNGDGPSSTYGFLLSIDQFNHPHFHMASGGVNFGDDGVFDVPTSLPVTDSVQWHHLFVSIDRSDNSRCRMYLDGIDRTGASKGNVALVAEVANTLRFLIGTENDNGFSYSGAIDEVHIAFCARSEDWVRLCYQNQKEQDALVRW